MKRIIYFLTKNTSFKNNIMPNSQVLCKDPISELIEQLTIEEIESLYNIKLNHLLRKQLNKLLYDCNEIFKIIGFTLKYFSNFVHLAMLIEEDVDLINFSYRMYLIYSINLNKDKCNILEKIILSIIIIRLIHNYRGLDLDFIRERDQEQLKKIEDENIRFINDNINNFIDIGLVDSTISVEDLYCEIIYKVLQGENFEYIMKIFECLHLTSINFTNKMYERLLKLFDERFVEKYQIINTNDLNNNNKILFYYVLFYYILKNPFYIYQIPFLFKTQKFFRQLIKSNHHNNILSELDESLSDKIMYIFRVLLDSDYYLDSLANYLTTIQYSNQSIIVENYNNNNNNNNIELNNLEREIELIKYEILTTHRKISIINNRDHNKNNLTEKNNNNNVLEEIEEENYTEENFKSNKINKSFKIEEGQFFNHIIFEYNYDDKIADGVLKCYKIINGKKQHFSGKGNYYNDTLSESEELINEALKKDNKFTFSIDDYQIEVYTYNSYIEGYDNKLIFFNKKNKEIITEIKGYSFPISTNGMAIMHNEILICPCKKYLPEQKQGILSIYFNIKQNQYLPFLHEIKDFVVNCICVLLNPDKKETNLVLVGGYSKDESIRLYKINYNSILQTIEVQFIRDIVIIENNFFTMTKRQIYSIKQSKKSGKITIRSNKNIYLCSPLDLRKYLYFQELEKKECFYEDYDDSKNYDRLFY